MTHWRDAYRAKSMSAEQAVRLIEPGERILIGSGAAKPVAPYVEPRFADRFRHKSLFIGPNVRSAAQEGRADFIPVFLSEIPQFLRSRLPVAAALIQVGPPDNHGYVSPGVSVDIVRAAVDSARMVIAEVNPRMPRTRGDTALHVERLTAIVEVERRFEA